MTDEELKKMQKDMRKKKRIATEFASQVHDLVEDRLWTDYPQLVELAQQTTAACEAWKAAEKELEAVTAD